MGSIFPGVFRSSLASHKPTRALGPSVEPVVGVQFVVVPQPEGWQPAVSYLGSLRSVPLASSLFVIFFKLAHKVLNCPLRIITEVLLYCFHFYLISELFFFLNFLFGPSIMICLLSMSLYSFYSFVCCHF